MTRHQRFRAQLSQALEQWHLHRTEPNHNNLIDTMARMLDCLNADVENLEDGLEGLDAARHPKPKEEDDDQ